MLHSRGGKSGAAVSITGEKGAQGVRHRARAARGGKKRRGAIGSGRTGV